MGFRQTNNKQIPYTIYLTLLQYHLSYLLLLAYTLCQWHIQVDSTYLDLVKLFGNEDTIK